MNLKSPSQVKAMGHPSLKIGPDQSSADTAATALAEQSQRQEQAVPESLVSDAEFSWLGDLIDPQNLSKSTGIILLSPLM
jgi:hypothetical protein